MGDITVFKEIRLSVGLHPNGIAVTFGQEHRGETFDFDKSSPVYEILKTIFTHLGNKFINTEMTWQEAIDKWGLK